MHQCNPVLHQCNRLFVHAHHKTPFPPSPDHFGHFGVSDPCSRHSGSQKMCTFSGCMFLAKTPLLKCSWRPTAGRILGHPGPDVCVILHRLDRTLRDGRDRDTSTGWLRSRSGRVPPNFFMFIAFLLFPDMISQVTLSELPVFFFPTVLFVFVPEGFRSAQISLQDLGWAIYCI